MAIAPHVAGHLLGGTVWKITKDGEDVIYAVDFNHRKEKHLNGIILESFVRPAVMITDAYNTLNNQPPKQQRQRDTEAGGNVLLPIETAGRVLELLLVLEEHWSLKRLKLMRTQLKPKRLVKMKMLRKKRKQKSC